MMISELLNESKEKHFRAHFLSSEDNYHAKRQSSRTRILILRTRMQIISCGNRLLSFRIAFANSALFWYCGLRWFTLHQWSPILLDCVDFSGNGRSIASCIILYGLSLSSIKINLSANGPVKMGSNVFDDTL